jgi:hypothetical protein
MAVNEFAVAIIDILTVFANDPQMTEEVTSCAPDDLTAGAAALVKIREIARTVLEGRHPDPPGQESDPVAAQGHVHDWETVNREHHVPWTPLGTPLTRTIVLAWCRGCHELTTWTLDGRWGLDDLRVGSPG